MADNTKDQVRELVDKGKSAKEIAETLGKTPATVYVHIRNIKAERGDKTPAKRGRPPKLQSQGSESKPEASKPKPASTAKDNGHDASRFPKVRAAVEQELADARRTVTVLEKMLETV